MSLLLLGPFSSYRVPLFSLDIRVYAYTYCDLLCDMRLMSLEGLLFFFFSEKKQKRKGSEREDFWGGGTAVTRGR